MIHFVDLLMIDVVSVASRAGVLTCGVGDGYMRHRL